MKITYHVNKPMFPSHYIEAVDSEGNTFGFRSDGQTVKPGYFWGATMTSGNEFDDFGHPMDFDKPVSYNPTIYVVDCPHPEMIKRDLQTIRAAIQAIVNEPLHFSSAGTTTVTI